MKKIISLIPAAAPVLIPFTSVLAAGEKASESASSGNEPTLIAGIIVTAYVTVRLLIQQKKMKDGGNHDKTDKM